MKTSIQLEVSGKPTSIIENKIPFKSHLKILASSAIATIIFIASVNKVNNLVVQKLDNIIK